MRVAPRADRVGPLIVGKEEKDVGAAVRIRSIEIANEIHQDQMKAQAEKRGCSRFVPETWRLESHRHIESVFTRSVGQAHAQPEPLYIFFTKFLLPVDT